MPRIYECPKCGTDISESYQEAEFDVGLYGGWFCEKCNEGFADEDDDDDLDYGYHDLDYGYHDT